jgi:cytochrome c553
MKKAVFFLAVGLACGCIGALLLSLFPVQLLAQEDSVSRGAHIAALGNGKGSPACASCHSYNGIGDPTGAFPRLSGQSLDYLRRSLDAFANGQRKNSVMSPIASALSDQERSDVAAYYTSVLAAMPPTETADPSLLKLGSTIANVGLNDQQLPACVTCHGPNGHSPNPLVPSLAGQYRNYIVFELKMFRQNYRQNDTMDDVAHSLTEEQSRAVAAYFEKLGASVPAGDAFPAGKPAK